MADTIMKFECPKCHKLVPFQGNTKFCVFCGAKLRKKDIKTFTLPMCPQGIKHGHCDECKKGKHKGCDDCGGREEVEYRPQWGNKCLCWPCREGYATIESLERSW